MLVQIYAPHFTAGLEFQVSSAGPQAIETLCIRSAPILNYMLGWTVKAMADYCDIKEWDWRSVGNNKTTGWEDEEDLC